jgi:hypothetical protein
MFSVITNIYNKKTKGPTLMELLTAIGKLKQFFWQLEMFDVCTTSDTAHIDTIFKFLRHTRQHECIDILIHTLASPSGRNVNYDNKKTFWGGKKIRVVPSICRGFVNTCPTVFLSQIFVIPEYIMQQPVCIVQ